MIRVVLTVETHQSSSWHSAVQLYHGVATVLQVACNLVNSPAWTVVVSVSVQGAMGKAMLQNMNPHSFCRDLWVSASHPTS